MKTIFENMELEINEGESILCSGFKFRSECPHKGEYQDDSSSCKECEDDAIKAIEDTYS